MSRAPTKPTPPKASEARTGAAGGPTGGTATGATAGAATGATGGAATGDSTLLVALPKGRMADATLGLFAAAGLPLPAGKSSRKLVLSSEQGELRYIMAKPSDVPTFVEYGAADVGICGLDTLRESRRQVYEPLLLPFGHCRLSLAGPAGRADTPLRYESQPRVATKYPNLTEQFFRARGVNAEIIALNGSVELGPLVGLADLIVDLVQTGGTLHANGLAELRVIMDSQAVLIVNRTAYHLKAAAVQELIRRLRTASEAAAREAAASEAAASEAAGSQATSIGNQEASETA